MKLNFLKNLIRPQALLVVAILLTTPFPKIVSMAPVGSLYAQDDWGDEEDDWGDEPVNEDSAPAEEPTEDPPAEYKEDSKEDYLPPEKDEEAPPAPASQPAEPVKPEKTAAERKAEREFQDKYRTYFYKVMEANQAQTRLPARTGWMFGLQLGFHPNLANSGEEGFALGAAPVSLPGVDNRVSSNYQNGKNTLGLSQIANLYQAALNENIAGKGKADSGDELNASAAIDSFPINFSVTWLLPDFLIKTGVTWHSGWNTLGGTNEYTTVFTNANGQKETVTTTTRASLSRLEVPLTLALRFLHNRVFGAYIGGGATWFHGRNTLEYELESSKDSFEKTSEKNEFVSNQLGVHFVLGLQTHFTDKIAVTTELVQNFGRSDLTFDEHKDKGEAPTAQSLNFSGTEILVGIHYLLE